MNNNPIQQDTKVIISGGKRASDMSYNIILDSYKYWEIVGALMWKCVDRFEAYDLAKWIRKASVKEEKEIKIGDDIKPVTIKII